MVNITNSDSDFCEQISHKCLDYASEILKFSSFKDLQTKAILSALKGRDVFVNLPTGYGKSGIFEAIPLCYDYLRNEEACRRYPNSDSRRTKCDVRRGPWG